MAEKQILSFRVSPLLAEAFKKSTGKYYGKLGLCFSASLLMFMQAEPEVQGEFLKKVFDAEVSQEVEATIEAVLAEQSKKMSARRQK